MPMDPSTQLSKKILTLLAIHGVDRRQLAERTGFPIERINEVLDGRALPTAGLIAAMCRFFRVTDTYFNNELFLLEGWIRSHAAPGSGRPAAPGSARAPLNRKEDFLTIRERASGIVAKRTRGPLA